MTSGELQTSICAILSQIAHRPDRQIDRAVDLAEAGAAFAGSRVVDDGEKLQRGRRHAALAVAVAKRQLHPFVVELALDAQPFFPQAAAIGQGGGEKPERLGGFPDQIRRSPA